MRCTCVPVLRMHACGSNITYYVDVIDAAAARLSQSVSHQCTLYATAGCWLGPQSIVALRHWHWSLVRIQKSLNASVEAFLASFACCGCRADVAPLPNRPDRAERMSRTPHPAPGAVLRPPPTAATRALLPLVPKQAPCCSFGPRRAHAPLVRPLLTVVVARLHRTLERRRVRQSRVLLRLPPLRLRRARGRGRGLALAHAHALCLESSEAPGRRVAGTVDTGAAPTSPPLPLPAAAAAPVTRAQVVAQPAVCGCAARFQSGNHAQT